MRFTKKSFMFLSSIILVLMLMLSSLTSFATGIDSWTTKKSMTDARQNFKVAVLDGKIYAIGGYDGTRYLNSVEEYNPQTDTWTPKASMDTARSYLQVAVLNGKIYAMGGYNGNTLSSVEEYDPITNTWTSKAAMADARQYYKVAVVGGKIYAIGGYNGNNILSSVEEYDPAKNNWTKKASMPTAREYHKVAVVRDKIYAIGGYNGDTLNTVEEYDPAKNIWTKKASMPTARYNHELAVYNEKIYAIGGNSHDSVATFNSFEEYDTVTDKWTIKASLTQSRRSHAVTVVGEKIYVIGGYTNNGGSSSATINSVEAYSLLNGTWTTRATMPTAIRNHEIAEVGGKIYAIGGSSNTVEEYSTEYSSLLPPTNLTAAAGNAKVDLSWSEVNGVTDYTVKRSTTAGGPYEIIASNITGTTYIDTKVANGTTYYYVVSALNTDGESLNSDEAYATPTNPTVTLEITSVDKAKLGDEITANIVIHNATNICAEDLKIAYDTSKLQFVSVENAGGMKIYKEDDIASEIKRYIMACLGKANAANGDKILLKMKFKAIDKGEAKIDITNGRIADNATLEMDVSQENCGEKTILIEGVKDVNRTGEYTLLDLGIDAWYYGSEVAETDTSKYDADQIINGTIDDDDLTEIVTQILGNTNYTANK